MSEDITTISGGREIHVIVEGSMQSRIVATVNRGGIIRQTLNVFLESQKTSEVNTRKDRS